MSCVTLFKNNADTVKKLTPKNDGSDDYDYYRCNTYYILYITEPYVNELISLGFTPKILKLRIIGNYNTVNDIKIISIDKIAESEPTYCFNEPIKHRGIFNGILTCQSETYSLLIETYIKNKDEKTTFFNAISNYPRIKKKADWAQKWIPAKRSRFATRLIAFA